jgi:hypothetical protein
MLLIAKRIMSLLVVVLVQKIAGIVLNLSTQTIHA